MPRAPRTRYQSLSPPPSTTTARKLHLCPADGCSYSTVNSGDLSRHMKQHLSPEERANHMYKCPFCDYQELQKYNVGVHIAKHKDVKPFACPSCEKSYSDPATLTRHKKAKHNHRPHHTARYYLAREQDASEPPSPTPKGGKKRSSSRRKPASDEPAWSALQDDDDFAPPRPLDSDIEPLPSFKDLKLGDAALDAEMRADDRESRRSLFTQSADGRFRLPELPPMRPRPLRSMYRSPSSSSSLGLGRMSSSPSVSPAPTHWEYSHQWPRTSRPISPLSDRADDDYYYRSSSASSLSDSAYNDHRAQSTGSLSPPSSSTLSDRSTQSYHFVGRHMFKSGRGSSESEEEIDELEEGDEEFVPYRHVRFIQANCPSKGRTSNGPMVRY